MSDKKLSKTEQRQGIEAFFKGQKTAGPAVGDDIPGIDRQPVSVDSGVDNKEAYEQRQVEEVEAIQNQNAQNPAIAAKMQAANEAIRKYNEKMAAQLRGIAPAPVQLEEPAPVGEVHPAMEEDAIRKAFLMKLRDGQ